MITMTTKTETWWKADLWNPSDFKSIEVSAHTDKTVMIEGARKQRITDGHIIARSRSHLKSLLIAHFDREARKYEGWARQKRSYIEQIQAVSEDAK